ncbi:MAG TPA: hypothetical protein VKM55_10225 [Candidatus Lokiarchaeia archaeon]|nr:hypothetical protein [Candidatus Lokiarchaeia archaeon]
MLDGVIFDDEPNTFTLRFADPDELCDELTGIYLDEMEMEPWNEVVPVAAVSVPARSREEFAC